MLLKLSPKNFNNNGGNNDNDANDNNNNNDNEKEDFGWVEDLKQWPMVPSSSSSDSLFASLSKSTESSSSSSRSTTEESNAAKKARNAATAEYSGRYRGVNHLSNFIKFEAILDLAGSSGSSNNSSSSSSGGSNTEEDRYFPNIFTAADQLFKSVGIDTRGGVSLEEESIQELGQNEEVDDQAINVTTTVEDLIEREVWLFDLPKVFDGAAGSKEGLARLSLTQTSAISSSSSTAANKNVSQAGFTQVAEAILKDATSRIEYVVNEASSAFSPNSVQDLVVRASRVFSQNNTARVTDDIVKAAERIAKVRGLDVQAAAERALETTKYAATLAAVANGLLGAGYAYGTRSGVSGSEEFLLSEIVSVPEDSKPLFADFATARRVEPFQYESVVVKGSEMGSLAGAIYEEDLSRCYLKLGHSIVANGTTADVAWMVTDSLDYQSRYQEPDSNKPVEAKPLFVRTITFRGYDASDEGVDREGLLNTICTAAAELMTPATASVVFHSGLLSTARAIYKDVKTYIESTSPNHKIVLNGHSIGGSLSIIILCLLTCDYGVEFVQDRIMRVYTHGSPPIAMRTLESTNKMTKVSLKQTDTMDPWKCPILEAFGLPSSMVYGFNQPYDPMIRFFTEFDALYPLVDDLGEDEMTLYASGPRRSLRPITRAIIQSWDGWPMFRDNWKGTNQRYRSVGVQHLLLPEPLRYLNDRFVSVNIGVPPTEAIVRISSNELLPALSATFPLDVFQISLIPQAVRSFVHHFYPAYDMAFENYATKIQRKRSGDKIAQKKVNEKKKGRRNLVDVP